MQYTLPTLHFSSILIWLDMFCNLQCFGTLCAAELSSSLSLPVLCNHMRVCVCVSVCVDVWVDRERERERETKRERARQRGAAWILLCSASSPVVGLGAEQSAAL